MGINDYIKKGDKPRQGSFADAHKHLREQEQIIFIKKEEKGV